MADTLLFESQSTPLLRPFPDRLTSLTQFTKPSITLKQNKPLKFTLKCIASKTQNSANPHVGIKDKDPNSLGFLLNSVSKALNALKKPALTAILVGLLLMYDPNSAWAGSGGRMGGRSFSRGPSMSSSQGYSVRPGGMGRGLSYSVPFYAPSPFSGGGGFFIGPAYGFGAVSNLVWIMMGLAAFGVVSGLIMDKPQDGVLTATDKTSVIKLQVGLLGMARSLQSDLNRIAESADTSTPEGLSYVLTETILALLRHPDYCISAYASVDIKRSIEDGEKKFNHLLRNEGNLMKKHWSM